MMVKYSSMNVDVHVICDDGDEANAEVNVEIEYSHQKKVMFLVQVYRLDLYPFSTCV